MAEFKDYTPPQRLRSNVDVSPDGERVVYISNLDGQYNLYLVPTSGGAARQLTRYTQDAVRQVAWSPDGANLLYTTDSRGDEQFQVHLLALDEGEPRRLTSAADRQHVLGPDIFEPQQLCPFTPDGRAVVYAGNDRDPLIQDVLVHDLATDEVRRIESVDGVMLHGASVSPDGRWLLTAAARGNSNRDLGLVDLHEPGAPVRTVTAGDGRQRNLPGPWAPDSSGFHLRRDADGEFLALGFYTLATGEVTELIAPGWDVEQVASSADGSVHAWSVNQNGVSRLFVRRGGQPAAVQQLPAGVITSLALSARGTVLAFLIVTGGRPSEVAVLDLTSGELRYLTDNRPAALTNPVEPQLIRYPTHDGLDVPAWIYRPEGQVRGVLLSIHGGPQAQERPEYSYSGLYQYLLSQGVAILAPNVRGSTGYGKRYQRLILRDFGGGDLGDFEHAVKYLHALDWVDPSRIAVWGASYGGFASLSCLSRLPSLWAAGVSMVGMSNLLTLARSAPPTWRAVVLELLGDPDTEQESLLARSPITYADAITAPLFVIQGANDPRVPRAESDQIVAALLDRGVQVRYDVYKDEGHGFTNRANEIKAIGDVAQFLLANLPRKAMKVRPPG
jgi:dipeptidyl aminopeptidase/acylaminoacyl peptidase